MKEYTNQNLIIEAKNGNANAIAELFKLYWPAARATAFGVIGEFNLAEDSASEALFIAFKNINDLQEESKFGPWLHTIVIRTAMRFKQYRNNIGLKTQIKTEASNITKLEQRELAVLIQDAVASLKDILREVISLYYFEGYNIEQISDFLDIPIGTIKRRLHDGREALRSSAMKIIEGQKPMDNNREQTLKQINEFLAKGGDHEAFQTIARKALKLRPLPYELLRELLKKYSNFAKKLAEHGSREKLELQTKKIMEIINKPSPRVTDLNHPIGKVAADIKSQLPEFKEREYDINKQAENIIQFYSGKLDAVNMPPGFKEGIPGSFISLSKGSLFKNNDNSYWTIYEKYQNNESSDNKALYTKGYISEIIHLIWLRKETIELKSIEKFLCDLSKKVIPDAKIIFSPLEQPAYRSSLRMNFEGIDIPAAIGGICFPMPGLAEGAAVASILLYLEAWACAQSGQKFELTPLAAYLEQISKIKQDAENINP